MSVTWDLDGWDRLRRPGWGEPIFTGAAPLEGVPVPAFGDSSWSLEFYNPNPSTDASTIHWMRVPASFRDHLRLAAWALLNVPFPDELRTRYARQIRPTLGAFALYRTVTRWRRLTEWLVRRGVDSFDGLTAPLMSDFVASLERRVTPGTVSNDKIALLRLWSVGLQLPELALREPPPWLSDTVGYGERLQRSNGGENVTEPIDSATMSALLGWAMAVVDGGAAPIVEAFRFYRGPYRAATATKRGSGGMPNDYEMGSATTMLNGYLERLRDADEPFPGLPNGESEPVSVDARLIACRFKLSLAQVRVWVGTRPEVRAWALHRGLQVQPVPLDLGPEAARVLPASPDLREIPALVDLLEAACFIVISYLTGMRVGEVMALEAGSLAPSSRDGGWMLIRSRHFKGVRNKEGVHNPHGEVRSAPWVAVPAVVRAISAMEALRGGSGLLFPTARPDPDGRPRARSRCSMINAIERFVTHVNARQPGAIPPDPKGRITASRFRRTLAWHIANQPNGLVALAVQYGHLHTAVSEGYASRTRSGLQTLIDFETARTMAVNLSEAHEQLQTGEGVSGPAERLFREAARQAHEQYGGLITSQKQATSLLANKSLQVFENQQAFVWCNFRSDSALCLRETRESATTTPRLDRCKPGCGNIARTDHQALQLRERAAHLTEQAHVMPQPAAERLLDFAAGLVGRADHHDRTRTCDEVVDVHQ